MADVDDWLEGEAQQLRLAKHPAEGKAERLLLHQAGGVRGGKHILSSVCAPLA